MAFISRFTGSEEDRRVGSIVGDVRDISEGRSRRRQVRPRPSGRGARSRGRRPHRSSSLVQQARVAGALQRRPAGRSGGAVPAGQRHVPARSTRRSVRARPRGTRSCQALRGPGRRGVGAQPRRYRPPSGGQLLAGAREPAAGVRDLPLDGRSRRPGQPAQHHRGRITTALRDTDRAIVTYEAALEANRKSPTSARLRRHHAGQHGQGSRRAPGEPARCQPRRGGAGDCPRAPARASSPRSSPTSPRRTPIFNCCRRQTPASTRPTSRSAGSQASSRVHRPRRTWRCRSLAVGCASPPATRRGDRTLERASSVAQQNELLRHGARCARAARRGLQVARSVRGGAAAPGGVHAHPRADLQPRHRPPHQDAADLRTTPLAARDQAELLRVRTTELEELVDGRTPGPRGAALRSVRAARRHRRVSRHRLGRALDRVSASWRQRSRIELGEDRGWAEELRLAGRLHDVGKVGVPDCDPAEAWSLDRSRVRHHEDAHHGRRRSLRRQQVDA